MKTPRPYLLVGGLLGASLMAAASLLAARETPKRAAQVRPGAETLGYKSWTQVNPSPLLLPADLDALCVTPMGRQVIQTSQNPHRKRYFVVYVNPIGQDAMLHQETPVFPEGTVIVKEKRARPNSPAPELMTVMVKRQRGFAPASGDWEYMVLDGKGQRVSATRAIRPETRISPVTPSASEKQTVDAYCQSCHAMSARTDYVFRSYLPESARRRLHVSAPDTHWMDAPNMGRLSPRHGAGKASADGP